MLVFIPLGGVIESLIVVSIYIISMTIVFVLVILAMLFIVPELRIIDPILIVHGCSILALLVQIVIL